MMIHIWWLQHALMHASGTYSITVGPTFGFTISSFRVFQFDEDSRRFSLLAESSHHDHCVLCVRLLAVNCRCWLFSVGTDGRLMVWDITMCAESDDGDLGDPLMQVQLHQSGINALDIRNHNGELHVHFVTSILQLFLDLVDLTCGGDDTALTFVRLQLDPLQPIVVHRAIFERAHAAQITGNVLSYYLEKMITIFHLGIKFVDDEHLVTVSIDQRIILWGQTEDEFPWKQ
jgi:hypothetical protein